MIYYITVFIIYQALYLFSVHYTDVSGEISLIAKFHRKLVS